MPLFPLLFHGFRVINNTTQSPACQKNGGGRGKQNNQEDTLWLEALGFSIGAPLIVEYEEGSIHIRTLTAEELAAKEQREIQAELEKRIADLEQMKRRIDAEAASLSMVAEPSRTYAASKPESRNQ